MRLTNIKEELRFLVEMMKRLFSVIFMILASFCYAEKQNLLKDVTVSDPLIIEISNGIVDTQIRTILLEKKLQVDNKTMRCLMIAYIMPIRIEKEIVHTQIYVKPNSCGIIMPMIEREYLIQNYQTMFNAYIEESNRLYKENPYQNEQVPYSFTQILKQSDKKYVIINHI